VFNFQSIADELVAQGALEIVQAEDMANACIALFSSPEKVAEQTQKAQAVLAANRGALQRQLTIIEAISV
jgi:3-deoxy-D-manno-octulosonic-acid transferase